MGKKGVSLTVTVTFQSWMFLQQIIFFIFGGWLFWDSEGFFPSSVSALIYITSMKQDRSVKNFTHGKVSLHLLTFRAPGNLKSIRFFVYS